LIFLYRTKENYKKGRIFIYCIPKRYASLFESGSNDSFYRTHNKYESDSTHSLTSNALIHPEFHSTQLRFLHSTRWLWQAFDFSAAAEAANNFGRNCF